MSPAAGFFCGVRVMSKSAASLFRTVNIFVKLLLGLGLRMGIGMGMGWEMRMGMEPQSQEMTV